MGKKSEEEWKEILTPEEYRILREKGTEAPFSGMYNIHDQEGIFHCAGCGEALFSSDSKFDSGCGWPSFDKMIGDSVEFTRDTSHGMIRIETTCKGCGGHLGHIFDDGPTDTGKRFCINSLSIKFKEGE